MTYRLPEVSDGEHSRHSNSFQVRMVVASQTLKTLQLGNAGKYALLYGVCGRDKKYSI